MVEGSYARFQGLERDVSLNVLDFLRWTRGHDPHYRVSQQFGTRVKGVRENVTMSTKNVNPL